MVVPFIPIVELSPFIDAAPYSKSVILTSLGRKFPNAILRGFKVGCIFVLFVGVLDLMGVSKVFDMPFKLKFN